MRLSSQKIQFIKNGLKNQAPESEVYIFGSRADDHAKGGDIDILWLTKEKIPQQNTRKFKVEFYKKFGWQKIDIVNFTFNQEDIFKDIALSQAEEL
ncbi:MAG: nucleotidyltransferase domain-containing protein [Bacteroidales bacterium]|mgnify:CR=1 FL=1|nr:nucleotidyltransferase domain-containing protein [Bacteroidales bacterium]